MSIGAFVLFCLIVAEIVTVVKVRKQEKRIKELEDEDGK